MITLLPFLTAWLTTTDLAAVLLRWTHSATAALETLGHLAGSLLDLILA